MDRRSAGKSTWIEKVFQGECTVISTDNIIEYIASIQGSTYDEVFSQYIKPAEQMMWCEFDDAVKSKYYPIVIDRTNMSIKSRAKFFERLKNFHKGHTYKIHAVVYPKPDDVEHERRLNSRPGKTIPPQVLRSMISSFQMPTLGEGFSSITIIED